MKNTKTRELIQKTELDQPIVNVGKQGVTRNLISEIKMHAKKRKVIKIRIRRNILQNRSRDEVFAEIAHKTGLDLLKITGNTAIFQYSRKKKLKS